MEAFLKNQIISKSVKPVESVKIFFKPALHANIKIKFQDGTAKVHKLSSAFRLFTCTLQHVNVEKCVDISNDLCTHAPLAYYDIFGFKQGDIGRFSQGEHEMYILFL